MKERATLVTTLVFAASSAAMLTPSICDAQEGLSSALRMTQLDFYGDLIRDSRLTPGLTPSGMVFEYQNSMTMQLRVSLDRVNDYLGSRRFAGQRTVTIPFFGNTDTHVTSNCVWYNVASAANIYHLGPYIDGWKSFATNSNTAFEGHYGLQLKMGW